MTSESEIAAGPQIFLPVDKGELQRIMHQAREDSLSIKPYGGAHAVSSEGADLLVSLKNMKRVVGYNNQRKTITVESGITLGDLLKRLEYMNYTLELYGILPNMPLVDAVAVGLIGSSGTIARCLKSCAVLQSDGFEEEWHWPEENCISTPSSEYEQSLGSSRRNGPYLNILVYGLGVVGIIVTATLDCIPLHYVEEVTHECSRHSLFQNFHKINEGLFTHISWYPLLKKVVVTKNYYVKMHKRHCQPWWVECQESLFRYAHWLLYVACPFISWYSPGFSRVFSKGLCYLKTKTHSFRNHYCFRPQHVISVNSYCKGSRWALSISRLEKVMKEIEEWSSVYPGLCCSPMVIFFQSHHLPSERQPYLCPYTERNMCSLWTEWFSVSGNCTTKIFCEAKAEFEAILQKNGAKRHWLQGPIFVAPLLSHPKYKLWAQNRAMLDPINLFRTAYVEEDPFCRTFQYETQALLIDMALDGFFMA